MMRRWWWVATVLLITLVFPACGLKSSEVNELCLLYEGGWTQNKGYKGLLTPGATNDGKGFGTKAYCYRIDQRSYIAGVEGEVRDVTPSVVVSEDDVRLSVDYQLYFKLNRAEKTLRKFHENLGVKTKAWEEDGWKRLLGEYFKPQIDRSLEAAALTFEWRDLYGSEEARRAYQTDVVTRTKSALREVIGAGADYFCGPAYEGGDTECGEFTFTVGKPVPVNAAIIEAIESEQTAAANTVAQEQKNKELAARIEGERALVELYGPGGALLKLAIEAGKVTQIIVDSTGRLNVPPPSPPG